MYHPTPSPTFTYDDLKEGGGLSQTDTIVVIVLVLVLGGSFIVMCYVCNQNQQRNQSTYCCCDLSGVGNSISASNGPTLHHGGSGNNGDAGNLDGSVPDCGIGGGGANPGVPDGSPGADVECGCDCPVGDCCIVS